MSIATTSIPENYISIHFASNVSVRMIKHILKYATTFAEITNYTSDGFGRNRNVTKMNNDSEYELDLRLPFGITKIKYNNNDLYINYIQDTNVVGTGGAPMKFEELILYGNSKEYVSNFIYAARDYCIKPEKNDTILCRILRNGAWTLLNSINKRSENTLFLDFNIQDIFNDITEFFNSEQDYIDNGVPFKQNYLLHGVPGSGKTSIIYTIASKFNLDICFLSITKELDDNSFIRAITNLPDDSILVIEDIDALFIQRDSVNNVSFSAILNVLDGVLKKHKLLTFLTTNYKERLDSALFRSGRIDNEIEFTYIKPSQITSMFNHFFKNQESNLTILLNDLKGKKFSCSDLHRWCFKHRKASDISQHIEELLNNISYNNNNSLNHLYI